MSAEAFICGVKFPGPAAASVSAGDALVRTLRGPGVDLSQKTDNPSAWYTDQRALPSHWQADRHNQKGYESSYSETSTFVAPRGDSDEFRRQLYSEIESSQACSAFRAAEVAGSSLVFKDSVPLMMEVGYKVYRKSTSLSAYASDHGPAFEVIFDSAFVLEAAALMSSVVLLLLIGS